MSQADSHGHVPASTPVPTGAVHYSAGQSHPEAPKRPEAHAAAHVHAVPLRALIGVYVALLALTVLTVAVTLVKLDHWGVWVALAVAVAKAGLVAMYFMHLRWDSPFNGIVLIVAFFFVALFIGIAVMDSHYYAPNYERPGTGQAMTDVYGER